MVKNVFVVSLEKVSTRYTEQWYTHVPRCIENYANNAGKQINVVNIAGKKIKDIVTPGAFLDFAGTNIWKSSQMTKIGEMFQMGEVNPGDVFLYTDFWNPTVVQLKYMSELLGIPVQIVGIAHAGSYDPHDFLGRIVGDKPWIRGFERSLYDCFDQLIFATEFHKKMFAEAFGLNINDKKLVRSGFPMEYFPDLFIKYQNIPKQDQIIFPHRLAPEKQHDIFLDLAASMPEYKWVTCQDKKLTKHEYHTQLAESKILFSANLQETLGITSAIEGPLLNVVPLVPNRLSYTEIFSKTPELMYPSEWTTDFSAYKKNRAHLIERIRLIMNNYDKYQPSIRTLNKNVSKNFINPKVMLEYIV